MNYMGRLSRVSPHVMTLTGFFQGVIRRKPGTAADSRTNVVRYHILKCLERPGAHHLTEISNSLSVKKNTLSELLDRMVKDDLVERTFASDDRRKILLAITPKGRAAMKGFEKALMGNIEHFLEKLDEKDRRDVVEAIEVLIRIMIKKDRTTPVCIPR
jgi:DNA-binding MarR family transcriptional regulator